ncbi:MAG: hypothetical protein Q4G24_05030 [Paracoccus sp. (in: a-proteobacteria)]|uniref:hypothetical protein n=1 Tax=Paracoccus sp. TaxID=267 RepID=UPI0026E0FB12|nr:hypothetical protein [Paracoccus sp. (in: a-proteobacteria)]MDO5620815.1 hypothetical protein [Paracoccus sp. (in: a-proteobacteria)]
MADQSSGAGQRAQNHLVLSYLTLRRAIGQLGLFLPAALLAYAGVFGGGLLPTISDYYYSPMREVFVGTLCALSVFLWSYRGYADGTRWLNDRNVARVASLGILGVAWIPTLPSEPGPVVCTMAQCLLGVTWASRLHYACAVAFFAALAVFCLVLFVRGGSKTPEKRASNRLYRICGWVIVACMVLIAVASVWLPREVIARWSLVFWLEALATVAFSVSWQVKGDGLRPLVRLVER